MVQRMEQYQLIEQIARIVYYRMNPPEKGLSGAGREGRFVAENGGFGALCL